MDTAPTYTIFAGDHCLGSGTHAAALQIMAAQSGEGPTVLVFADADGRQTELDALSAPVPRGRGRPKLGVTAREVTLLPRHWDWLAAQPGGASVTLRKLVDQARRSPAAQARAARDAAYAFMSAMAGDLENFEEASRALFAGDKPTFERLTAKWPKDVRAHIAKLENP